MDKKNVTAAKPGIAGAISTAVAGTELPKDTAAALNEAFKSLGYISEDGLKNTKKSEGEQTKAWGGEIVLDNKEKAEDVFEFTLIETTNEDVLKAVYGTANVSGTLSAGLAVNVNDEEDAPHPFVVDMLLKGGTAKRIVIPQGKIMEVGEIVYKDNEITGYPVKLLAQKDATGNTHYEYIKAKGDV